MLYRISSVAGCYYLSCKSSELPPYRRRVVLEAAYEARLLAGILNERRGMSNRVLLTRLGGGAFGNDPL